MQITQIIFDANVFSWLQIVLRASKQGVSFISWSR